MKFLMLTLFYITGSILEASEASCKEYLELVEKYPNLVPEQGVSSKGEIEIILDKEKMLSIEKITGRTVGVVMRDNYWIWVNDACKFPNGKEGVYGRIIWVRGLNSQTAVAVMPILPDGKIVLNCNYRHTTRSWEIELPRGVINSGESSEDAARRETLEETGMIIDCIAQLGAIPPDSGVVSAVIPIFMAKVVAQQHSNPEDSEAIEDILALSISEIKTAFTNGFIELEIRGNPYKVPFRDPFLAYALLMLELING